MQQGPNGYSRDDIQALHATRRIHVLNRVVFVYDDDDLVLALLPDTDDPRYTPSSGTVQSASDDPRDVIEAAQQASRTTNVEYAKKAASLLNDAQAWLDDPNVKAHYGAQQLLKAVNAPDNGLRPPYEVLFREGDQIYQWWGSNGLPYALIVRAGRIVAAYRVPLLNQGQPS